MGSPSEANNNDPKTYGECVQSVSEVKKKFQEKAEAAKPGMLRTTASFVGGFAGHIDGGCFVGAELVRTVVLGI